MSDLKQAMLDPHLEFLKPEDVVGDPALSRREKAELLGRWAYDAVELDVAEEEGMGGGESGDLDRVLAALHEVVGRIDSERSAPTKQRSLAAGLDS